MIDASIENEHSAQLAVKLTSTRDASRKGTRFDVLTTPFDGAVAVCTRTMAPSRTLHTIRCYRSLVSGYIETCKACFRDRTAAIAAIHQNHDLEIGRSLQRSCRSDDEQH